MVAPISVVLLAVVVMPARAAVASDYADTVDNWHAADISALADLGVFDGTECGPGRFCPDEPLERWVMAVWLVRVLGGDGTSSGVPSRFADVDSSVWWTPYVEELADRSITAGCGTGPLRYCPDDVVTRGQMASFLVRAFDLAPADHAGFTDIAGNFHEPDVNALAGAGITVGCGTAPLRYCPRSTVTRGQMATFLNRALKQKEHDAPDSVGISDDVPDVTLTDLASGQRVNLRSLIPGDRAVLLWFWAEW